MNGRQRVAQIILDGLSGQGGYVRAEFDHKDDTIEDVLKDVTLDGHFNLLAVVDALVAAAPPTPDRSMDRRPDVVVALREGRKEPEIVSWNEMAVGEHWLYAAVSPEPVRGPMIPMAYLEDIIPTPPYVSRRLRPDYRADNGELPHPSTTGE